MTAFRSLVAVVVTCNRLAALQVTIARLGAVDPAYLTRIVVVDNASTDGTAAWLAQSQDGRLDVVTQPRNIGGAGGFEAGMRHAVETYDPDWIVVMDDDARPASGALEAFHTTARDHVEGWAAAVYHPTGEICDTNRPSLNPFRNRAVLWRTVTGRGREAFHLGPAAYAAPAPRAVDGASFVGFFVSRAGIARAGYPDGDLFIYGDDALYTLGLSAKGGQILFDPSLRFEHAYSTQLNGERRISPLWKCYYRYRNLLLVYRLCAGPWFVLVVPVVAFKWLAQVRFYGGARRRYLGVVLRAVRDGVARRTDVSFDQVKAWARAAG